MRRFLKQEQFASRAARDRGEADPLLTIEEQLDSVALELTKPINVDGKDTTEIVINAPTVDDLLDVQNREGNPKETQLRGLTNATGIPPEALRQLHPRDFTRLSELYWGFTV